ncbi:barstar family protein [Nonomuraea sp. NPDC052129]
MARALRLPDCFGRTRDAVTDSLRDTGAVSLTMAHAE